MNNLLLLFGLPALFSSMLSSLAGIPQCTLFDTRGC
ncbi:hypothetical protein SAMN06295981_0591 [Corynebacterium pollutisoli]|uniref:Uncharacterized protein n=1 Tax=Corynebacterium pollutisoli TaxID=1610489 RepID=A0A1X7IA60_9CORY|nr:hypothetical protein SAMN06295981_0591 [Corynebacterium pollutisoli]